MKRKIAEQRPRETTTANKISSTYHQSCLAPTWIVRDTTLRCSITAPLLNYGFIARTRLPPTNRHYVVVTVSVDGEGS
jgi:hypothetical protein